MHAGVGLRRIFQKTEVRSRCSALFLREEIMEGL